MPRYAGGYNPRESALQYASWADQRATSDEERMTAMAAQAVVAGLVYVGDQLGELVDAVRMAPPERQDNGGEET